MQVLKYKHVTFQLDTWAKYMRLFKSVCSYDGKVPPPYKEVFYGVLAMACT